MTSPPPRRRRRPLLVITTTALVVAGTVAAWGSWGAPGMWGDRATWGTWGAAGADGGRTAAAASPTPAPPLPSSPPDALPGPVPEPDPTPSPAAPPLPPWVHDRPPSAVVPLAAQDGLAPVITRVETTDPVVFLTIDDGMVRSPEALAAFREARIPATLFLNDGPVRADAAWFDALPGTLVEAHTSTHPSLPSLGEAAQRREICGNADLLEQTFGRRPVLLRPPFGTWSTATRRAAADCGMRAVVLWTQNVNGRHVGFREGQTFRPGDIVLMHFRDTFVEELEVVRTRVQEAGLRFALLEDYVAPDAGRPGGP